MKTGSEIYIMKSNFLRLDARLKRFGRTLCKFHKNRNSKAKTVMECQHPVMGWGGIDRNTDCELINCPRIINSDEGK